MEYLHVLLACAAEPWALHRDKLLQLSQFLCFKAQGGTFTAEEVRGRISQQTERQVARSAGNVGILPVYGVLAQRMNMMSDISGGSSTEQIAVQFREMLHDDNVKAIILDFDSPGGTVYGTEELAQEIFDSRGAGKPIVAQVNSTAASGAYWLASQADEIVVTPSGQAGSIGVYRIHEDVSKMLEASGVTTSIIKAGANKIEDNPLQPLSDDAREAMQNRVNQSYQIFVQAVARGRNTSKAGVLDGMGQGRMFGAADLIDRGMADRIATLPETLERFGGGAVNPIASANRARTTARAEAGEVLVTKLKAGDQLTTRELKRGLKGILGLTNSEADLAVEAVAKAITQGDLERPAEPIVPVADFTTMRGKADEISSILSKGF